MNEIWLPLKGYEGVYWVSSLGRVRNARHRILKPILVNDIMKYDLRNNGQRTLREVTIADFKLGSENVES